jgi:hypothetical protein
LEDEEFGITGLPDPLDPAQDDVFLLDVLRGRELCLTASNTDETMLTVWTLPVAVDGKGHVPAVGAALLHPGLGSFPSDGSSSLQQRNHLVASRCYLPLRRGNSRAEHIV